jgi:NAD(P)H dehydrogenase (quinone)
MTRVLILYYSSHDHMEKLAEAVAEGARATGAKVDVKRVPETVLEEIARSAHFRLDQAAPVATVTELEHYDAIIVGTRNGRMSSQMALPRSDRRPLDARSVRRQDRRGLHINRHPAWARR